MSGSTWKLKVLGVPQRRKPMADDAVGFPDSRTDD